MKRFIFAAFAAVALFACSDDNNKKNNGDPDGDEIVLSTEDQTVYADETTTVQNLEFTAPAAWTATVSAATRASNVSWLKLTADGTEKYSGAAGNVSLAVITLPNNTGADRWATITIASGDAEPASLTVVQKGQTVFEAVREVYGESDQTTFLPDPAVRKVRSVVYDPADSPYTVASFDYDDKGRIKRAEIYGDEYEFAYFNNRVLASYGDTDDGVLLTVQLGENGRAKTVTEHRFYEEDIYQTDIDVVSFDADGYLTDIVFQPYVYDPQNNENINEHYRWTNGNMTEYANDFYENGTLSLRSLLTSEFTAIDNKANIDLNFFFAWDGSLTYSSQLGNSNHTYAQLMILRLLGKSSAKMANRAVYIYAGDTTPYYDNTYTFVTDNNGYVTSGLLVEQANGPVNEKPTAVNYMD